MVDGPHTHLCPWSATVVKSLPLHVSLNLPNSRNGISCRCSLPRSCANPSLCLGTSWSEPCDSTVFVSVPCWLVRGIDLFAPYSPHPAPAPPALLCSFWYGSALLVSVGSSWLLLCLLFQAYHDAIRLLEFEIQRIHNSKVMSERIFHQVFTPVGL